MNCLVVSPDLVLHGASGVHESLSNPALGSAGDPERDLGPIAVEMLGDATHFLTGNTLVAKAIYDKLMNDPAISSALSARWNHR